MNIFRNSLLYIFRKKTRTFLIFIILTILVTGIYGILSVFKSTDKFEKSILENINTSFYVQRKDGNDFSYDFGKVKNDKDIKDINPSYQTFAKLLDKKVYEKNQMVKRDDLDDKFENLLDVEFLSQNSSDIYFSSGVFKLVNGKNLGKNDTGKVLIHKELGKINNLKVGDSIKLKFDNKTFDFTIAGIFEGKKQEQFTGLSSDFTENKVYLPYKDIEKIKGKKLLSKLNFFVKEPKKMEKKIGELKKSSFNSEDYIIEKNKGSYDLIKGPLKSLKEILKLSSYGIIFGGLSVLSLILILWLRERIYEIGTLLSLGISKLKIMGQFIIELIYISFASLFVGSFLANIFLDMLFKNLMEKNPQLRNLISQSLNFYNLFESYFLLVVIIVLSVILTSGFILLKKPKEILSKIS